jgi:predicted DNA-binding transcriptional regulator YafY
MDTCTIPSVAVKISPKLVIFHPQEKKAMYHPTTRLLTILELLQTHRKMSGEELAERLEVETRTVRRYIQMLQEIGMPVEGSRGPGGGYQLRPGFKLPPLLFTEEEATAIVLGLLGTHRREVDLPATAIEGALAKVYRVLPLRGRERLQAISAHMMLLPYQQEERLDAALILGITEAINQQRRIFLEYNSYDNEFSQRAIEPYGLLSWKGRWYIIAYCCLRQGIRTFRLDRIRDLRFLEETFVRDKNFDWEAYVNAHLTSVPERWQIEVEFQAKLHEVQRKIPSAYGQLSETPTGVRFAWHHDSLTSTARYLIGLDLPFVVHRPNELRDELVKLANSLLQIAQTHSS